MHNYIHCISKPLLYKHSATSIQIICHLYKNNFRFGTAINGLIIHLKFSKLYLKFLKLHPLKIMLINKHLTKRKILKSYGNQKFTQQRVNDSSHLKLTTNKSLKL